MENKRLTLFVIGLGFLAVAFGAFGAHALKPFMDENGINNFNTANRYHFYHVLLALGVAMNAKENQRRMHYCIIFSIIGIFLFSGSLYMLALKSTYTVPSWIPILTPVGGLFFLLAWVMLFLNFSQISKKN